MRFTDIFIKRPVLAVSISLLLLIVGLKSLIDMQVRQYPQMTNTVVTVTTNYYGADSELIAGFITQPLEQAIAQADNIDYMTSQSFLGQSVITVSMKLNTDPNAALAEILAQVNSVRSQLPKNSEDSSVEVSTGSQTSLMYITFSSNEINSSQLTDYLDRVVTPKLFSISGVSTVNLYGGIQYAMRVWLDPERMAAFQLDATQVSQILQDNNFQSAVGQATNFYTLFNGTAETQINTVEGLKNLVIGSYNGMVVRVRDIADVSLAKSHDTYRALADGKEAVIVAIDVTPTANPLEVAELLRQALPGIQKNLPSMISAEMLYDSSVAIDESINEIIHTIFEAMLIVTVVITLFLGSLRAVAIPVITIPLSLIGVFIVMEMFGFSLNLMTLLALVLAIGLVVDDAIVVVENVDRHIKEGETPFRAAIIGTREIAVPVISMTITLAAVYSPIALMGGLTGSLFKEFALTLAGAVFISGIIALTLSPMMCSKILKANAQPNEFEEKVNEHLTNLTHKYTHLLEVVLKNRIVVLVFSALVFASLPLLFSFIPQELAPKEDEGLIMMIGTAPSNANLDYIEANMKKVNDVLSKEPAAAASLSLVGIPNSNQSLGVVPMVPWSQRDISQAALKKKLEPELKALPGMGIAVFEPAPLPGTSSGLPIQFVITTANSFESLFEIGSGIFDEIKTNPKIIYSTFDLKFDSAMMKIKVKREMAGSYNITMRQIGETMSLMMSDGYLNRINLDGRSYEVIPQVARKYRDSPEALKNYYIKAGDGRFIPLSSLLDIEIKGEPRAYPHFNQLNSFTISAVATPGVTIGDAVAVFEEFGENLPVGYTYDFLGEARQFTSEGNALYGTFGLALAIIFLVLASQFESIRDPLVILLAVPLAMSGALVAMSWAHVISFFARVPELASMNIYSQVGLITLVGLIAKHGILMCEVAKEEQLEHGRSRIDAIKHAAIIRLRPILMTTAAMVAGLIPLLYATGSGAAARFSIGLVIVAGLSIGTLFTLFVLPVIYTYLAEKHKPIQQFQEKPSLSH